MICQCLLKLKDIGVLVKTVTFDGPACNFAMLDCLGIELSPPLVIKTWFLHPADSAVNVYAILDVCHMLKLVRNCFASYGILIDDMGGKINWNYVEQLHKLQEAEEFRLDNKLACPHDVE